MQCGCRLFVGENLRYCCEWLDRWQRKLLSTIWISYANNLLFGCKDIESTHSHLVPFANCAHYLLNVRKFMWRTQLPHQLIWLPVRVAASSGHRQVEAGGASKLSHSTWAQDSLEKEAHKTCKMAEKRAPLRQHTHILRPTPLCCGRSSLKIRRAFY